jgi:isoaspartyl peptidase/L-asparaginase-like protein (Ntn-hydrolase superfamily)
MTIQADKYTLISCGAYAGDAIGSASVIAWGESVMKVMLAKSTIDFVEKGDQAGYAFNTPFMARALADETGIRKIWIKPARKV